MQDKSLGAAASTLKGTIADGAVSALNKKLTFRSTEKVRNMGEPNTSGMGLQNDSFDDEENNNNFATRAAK